MSALTPEQRFLIEAHGLPADMVEPLTDAGVDFEVAVGVAQARRRAGFSSLTISADAALLGVGLSQEMLVEWAVAGVRTVDVEFLMTPRDGHTPITLDDCRTLGALLLSQVATLRALDEGVSVDDLMAQRSAEMMASRNPVRVATVQRDVPASPAGQSR